MANTVSGTSATLTFANKIDLIVSPESKDIQMDHIADTDLTIARNRGKTSRGAVLTALETFAVYATADAFINSVSSILGEACAINKDGEANYTGFILVSHDNGGIQPNNAPGFQVAMQLSFIKPSTP